MSPSRKIKQKATQTQKPPSQAKKRDKSSSQAKAKDAKGASQTKGTKPESKQKKITDRLSEDSSKRVDQNQRLAQAKKQQLEQNQTLNQVKKQQQTQSQTLNQAKRQQLDQTRALDQAKQQQQAQNQILDQAKRQQQDQNQTLDQAKKKQKDQNQTLEQAKKQQKDQNQALEQGKKQQKDQNQALDQAKQKLQEQNKVQDEAKNKQKDQNRVLDQVRMNQKEQNLVLSQAKEQQKEQNRLLTQAKKKQKQQNSILNQEKSKQKEQNLILDQARQLQQEYNRRLVEEIAKKQEADQRLVAELKNKQLTQNQLVAKEEKKKQSQDRLVAKEEKKKLTQDQLVVKETEKKRAQDQYVDKETQKKQNSDKLAKEESEKKQRLDRLVKDETEKEQKLDQLVKEETEKKQKLDRLLKDETEKKQKLDQLVEEETEKKQKQDQLVKDETEKKEQLDQGVEKETEKQQKLDQLVKDETEKKQQLDQRVEKETEKQLQLDRRVEEETKKFQQLDQFIEESTKTLQKIQDNAVSQRMEEEPSSDKDALVKDTNKPTIDVPDKKAPTKELEEGESNPILDRTFSTHECIRKLWMEAIAASEMANERLTIHNARDVYQSVLKCFVRRLIKEGDPVAAEAREIFRKSGFKFLKGSDGKLKESLPVIDLPDIEDSIRIDPSIKNRTQSTKAIKERSLKPTKKIDWDDRAQKGKDLFRLSGQHLFKLSEHPRWALDPDNLAFMLARDNIHMDIDQAFARKIRRNAVRDIVSLRFDKGVSVTPDITRQYGLLRVEALKEKAKRDPRKEFSDLYVRAAESLNQEIDRSSGDPQLRRDGPSFKEEISAVRSVDLLNDSIDASRSHVSAEVVNRLEQIRDIAQSKLLDYESMEKIAVAELNMEVGSTVEGLSQIPPETTLNEYLKEVFITKELRSLLSKEITAHQREFPGRNRSERSKLRREKRDLQDALFEKLERRNLATILKQHIREQVATEIDHAMQEKNRILNELPDDVRSEIARAERELLQKRIEMVKFMEEGLLQLSIEIGKYD